MRFDQYLERLAQYLNPDQKTVSQMAKKKAAEKLMQEFIQNFFSLVLIIDSHQEYLQKIFDDFQALIRKYYIMSEQKLTAQAISLPIDTQNLTQSLQPKEISFVKTESTKPADSTDSDVISLNDIVELVEATTNLTDQDRIINENINHLRISLGKIMAIDKEKDEYRVAVINLKDADIKNVEKFIQTWRNKFVYYTVKKKFLHKISPQCVNNTITKIVDKALKNDSHIRDLTEAYLTRSFIIRGKSKELSHLILQYHNLSTRINPPKQQVIQKQDDVD